MSVVYQYRAAMRDHSSTPDYGSWRDQRVDAEDDAQAALDAEPPFDEVWIERRPVPVDPPVGRFRTLRGPASSVSSGGTDA